MNVNVNWDKVPSSRWAEARINEEADRLASYIPSSSRPHFRVGQEGNRYRTKVHVHALGRDWIAAGDGDNLWEGIAAAFSKIKRKLGEFKSAHKNRIHRQSRDQNLTLF